MCSYVDINGNFIIFSTPRVAVAQQEADESGSAARAEEFDPEDRGTGAHDDN